ncbi:uncharacterized protein [Hyperolius riggenbachi]|uniref:uncharacterized protein n=1 Tax=Hyperolius riggenbachi TaxID=752182 RepID=UPI0035A31B9C
MEAAETLWRRAPAALSLEDVYSMAKSLGSELQSLTKQYGPESVSGVVPQVVRVLELLESFAASGRERSYTEQELLIRAVRSSSREERPVSVREAAGFRRGCRAQVMMSVIVWWAVEKGNVSYPWAQTGFPWIDAIMTQLREEGWIHHLARHAVACFLTRGDLWISWEEGMKVHIPELLLDADYSMNAGNWMWLSASALFHHYTRIFCPVRFGRRTDSEGNYIRKYLPVLKDFPAKYIY